MHSVAARRDSPHRHMVRFVSIMRKNRSKIRGVKANMRCPTDDVGRADVIRHWTLGPTSRINRSEMDDVAFSRLNQRQRECLRLVYRNLEAKEIARELGLS